MDHSPQLVTSPTAVGHTYAKPLPQHIMMSSSSTNPMSGGGNSVMRTSAAKNLNDQQRRQHPGSAMASLKSPDNATAPGQHTIATSNLGKHMGPTSMI